MLAPPAGYVDESPVYRIEGTSGASLPVPALVKLPFHSNISSVSPELSIYASTDGITCARAKDSYLNAGFLKGSLSKFGYMVAGYPRTAAELAACGVVGALP